jgi:hypothetical protein
MNKKPDKEEVKYLLELFENSPLTRSKVRKLKRRPRRIRHFT